MTRTTQRSRVWTYLGVTIRTLGTLACMLAAVSCKQAAQELEQKAMDTVGDKVREVVTDKLIEGAITNQGAKNAKVDLGKDGAKVSLTDKDGKDVSFATGNNIKWSESDFGVSFYPGAKISDEKSVRIVSGDAHQFAVSMDTTDKFDKVSGFYRDKLKALAGAAGDKAQFNEMAEGSGNVKFILVDQARGGYLMVSVEAPSPEATTVMISSQGKTPAAAKPDAKPDAK